MIHGSATKRHVRVSSLAQRPSPFCCLLVNSSPYGGRSANQSFAEKLKELTAGNKIGGEEKEILSVLADAGSAAAHRGWKPTEGDINHLMDALENFLER